MAEEQTHTECTVFEVEPGVFRDAWGNEAEEDSAQVSSADYHRWSASRLAEEIDLRNRERADEDKITLSSKKKSAAITALQEDDAAQRGDTDDDGE